MSLAKSAAVLPVPMSVSCLRCYLSLHSERVVRGLKNKIKKQQYFPFIFVKIKNLSERSVCASGSNLAGHYIFLSLFLLGLLFSQKGVVLGF